MIFVFVFQSFHSNHEITIHAVEMKKDENFLKAIQDPSINVTVKLTPGKEYESTTWNYLLFPFIIWSCMYHVSYLWENGSTPFWLIYMFPWIWFDGINSMYHTYFCIVTFSSLDENRFDVVVDGGAMTAYSVILGLYALVSLCLAIYKYIGFVQYQGIKSI